MSSYGDHTTAIYFNKRIDQKSYLGVLALLGLLVATASAAGGFRWYHGGGAFTGRGGGGYSGDFSGGFTGRSGGGGYDVDYFGGGLSGSYSGVSVGHSAERYGGSYNG
ncbi:uncharacterized protein LOC143041585 [Oratosquilla oratoria]|uniref:uncharacterized protein LOC143041585 n=1 Tax=Oratosquilla oratoria TaxID=337810 RepID=UPI003F765EDC